MRFLIFGFAMTMLVAACSSHHDSATMTGSPASAATNVLAGTPMAPYGHDLDKAKNVQNIINAQAARQAHAIKAATGTSG